MKHIMGMTALLLIIALVSACSSPAANKEAKPQDINSSAAASIPPTPSPSPSPLVPPDLLREEDLGIIPTTISIPAIDVKAAIENVGTMENGQMGVPQHIDGVGWFEPGTKPGAKGNAVMAGHVDSLTGPAVFYKLDRLKAGDEIIVSDKEGTTRTFIVMDKQRYPREEAPLEDIFGFSYQSHLNLITCTGEFNDEAKTHEERLVIYTELKK
ncbi:class F sortase [Candidatus Pristimantibacillus sp. PTI5]|uniref:class F sortase n=1 Tax=Candidatus Pristimantibacillus sp. PTI5 TaxID=3400422 RepID=UPI003B027472